MTSDQVNQRIEKVKALIVKGQRLDAEEILDALPVIVQLSPAVLALRNQVKKIKSKEKRKGRPRKNQAPVKEPAPKPKAVKKGKTESVQAPPSPKPSGIHFLPVEGAGMGGGVGFRCVVVDSLAPESD